VEQLTPLPLSGKRPLPPLWGASERLKRAAHSQAELHAYLQGWSLAHTDFAIVFRNEAGELQARPRKPNPPVEMLGEASIIFGECLYHLRAALDYIVFDMCCAVAGKAVGGTQWPIEDDPAMFRARVTGKHPKTKKKVQWMLRGLPKEIVDLIFKFQPCATPKCEWTKRLQELSNPDKHKAVSAFRSTAQVLEPSPTDPPDVKAVWEVLIRLSDDGSDVIGTLEFFEREVGAAIDLFRPFFRPRNSVS
jgi:hypothetical protein